MNSNCNNNNNGVTGAGASSFFPVFGGGQESNATSVTLEDRLNEQPSTIRQWTFN